MAMNRFLFNLAKTILLSLLDKSIKAALPKIYEKLDVTIPVALFNGASPRIIKSEIEHVVMKTTGRPANEDVIDLIAALYNPLKNAERIQRQPR